MDVVQQRCHQQGKEKLARTQGTAWEWLRAMSSRLRQERTQSPKAKIGPRLVQCRVLACRRSLQLPVIVTEHYLHSIYP
jgi:hypothetical protein